MYRGVGKMCVRLFHRVRFFVNSLIYRFMMVPRATMEKDLKDQEKGFTDDITSLNKKVCSLWAYEGHTSDNCRAQTKYLEKQFNEAQSQLRDIVSLAFHLIIRLCSLITFSTSSIMLLSNSEIWLLYPLVLYPCNSYL